MDVLLLTLLGAAVAVGMVKALLYIRKHDPKIKPAKATTDEEDKTFFDLIRPIWKNPPSD